LGMSVQRRELVRVPAGYRAAHYAPAWPQPSSSRSPSTNLTRMAGSGEGHRVRYSALARHKEIGVGEEQLAWICDESDLLLRRGKRVSGRCGSERASQAGRGSPRPAVGPGLGLRRTGARLRRAERERYRA